MNIGQQLVRIRRFLSFTHRPREIIIVVFVVVLLRATLTLVDAGLKRVVVDHLLARQSEAFVVAAALMIGVEVLRAGLLSGWRYMSVRYSADLAAGLRNAVAGRILNRPLAEAEQHSPGEIASRTTSDIEETSGIINVSYDAVVAVVLALAASCYMILLDPRVGVASVAAGPLVGYVGRHLSRPISSLAQHIQTSYAELSSHADDVLSNRAVVRVFGFEDRVQEEFERLNTGVFRRRFSLTVRMALLEAAVWMCAGAPLLIPLAYGGYLVLRGEMTAGTIMAILYLTNYTRAPLAELGEAMGKLQRALGSGEDVLEIIDSTATETVEEDRSMAAGERGPGTGLVVHDLTFHYRQDMIPTLSDVTLRAAPGEWLFFVGPSGAGKSTLLKILGGLYPVPPGMVYINGKSIDDYDAAAYPAVYVPQEPYLFPVTIRENLLLASPEATDEDVLRVLRTAGAEFVLDLSGGLDHTVSERGESLSGGQRARVCLARALLKNPEVLLLDEPGANLDAITEEKLMARLRRDLPETTVLAATHRLAPISEDDAVVVMQDGEIARLERGSDLIARRRSGPEHGGWS